MAPAPDRPVVLVHGGLAEDMDARRFWVEPGIVAALARAGHEVHAPDRDTCPASWIAAADALAREIDRPATVVAGSNGVSVAVRLALQHPDLVARLVLLWPATASAPDVDVQVPPAAGHLIAGETLRGVADHELTTLDLPVAVMASEPETPFHQHHTVERLLALIPSVERVTPEFPESPRPDLGPQLDEFIAALTPHLSGQT